MAKPVLFRCSNTKLMVQAFITSEPSDDASRQYETIECLACRQLHLLNLKSGDLLSDAPDE